jgi:hypothetical protein
MRDKVSCVEQVLRGQKPRSEEFVPRPIERMSDDLEILITQNQHSCSYPSSAADRRRSHRATGTPTVQPKILVKAY